MSLADRSQLLPGTITICLGRPEVSFSVIYGGEKLYDTMQKRLSCQTKHVNRVRKDGDKKHPVTWTEMLVTEKKMDGP